MSAGRLMLDEMYPPEIARQLGRRGHDVLAVVADPALAALPDDRIIEFAAGDDRCLVTENWSDFEDLRDVWEKEQRVHGGLLLHLPKALPAQPPEPGADHHGASPDDHRRPVARTR